MTTLTQTSLRVEQSPRWVRGFVRGQSIVDSKRVLVVYGERRLPLYYFPLEDVRSDLLHESRSEDGVQFWSLESNDHHVEDICWSRPTGDGEWAALREYVAFDWKKVEQWYEED